MIFFRNRSEYSYENSHTKTQLIKEGLFSYALGDKDWKELANLTYGRTFVWLQSDFGVKESYAHTVELRGKNGALPDQKVVQRLSDQFEKNL